MKKLALVVGLAATLVATAAEAMTVQEFLTAAARIPRNPTALLRADTRRLIAEVRTASETIGNEREAAIAAGRRPPFCPTGKVSISAESILARFNSIPPARRNISVTQAMREWMAERHPCPAS